MADREPRPARPDDLSAIDSSAAERVNDPATQHLANENTDSFGDTPNDAQLSFETLMTKARAGDNHAAGLLVENYRNYLLLIANEDLDRDLQAKLGASDVVQESMMRAQAKLDQFRGSSEQEWRAWLRTILLKDLLKSRRTFHAQKRNADREVNLQDHSAVARNLIDAHLTPSSEAVKLEKAKSISAAITKLEPDHRTVVQLRNFEQLSLEEIGERMNRSPDAARKLWARAIEALQRILIQESPELISGQFPVDPDES